MEQPLVSIIMPVYNCEKYIAAAMDSMLQQSFQNFELIVLEDCSTDNTAAILKNYTDSRIKLVLNTQNIGLIPNLNKGIDLVSPAAKYVARMDGDDISMLNRLTMQVDFLEATPNVDVVAATVKLIDENGHDIGTWKEDVIHTSIDQIRSFLSFNNCIAHPTVMLKAPLIKQLRYEPNQMLSEDYDLWLRCMSQNKTIAKIAQPLVLHRILSNSFTRTRNIGLFKRMRKIKWTFVRNEIKSGRFNFFVFKTAVSGTVDILRSIGKTVKSQFKK
jgi:glycosyltransferase involved in cell wall biosynthesis